MGRESPPSKPTLINYHCSSWMLLLWSRIQPGILTFSWKHQEILHFHTESYRKKLSCYARKEVTSVQQQGSAASVASTIPPLLPGNLRQETSSC